MNIRFSFLLKKYRENAKKSQSALFFEVFGKEKGGSNVSNWEKGNSKPAFDDFLKLCDYFKCTPNELLLGEESYPMNEIQPDIAVDTQMVLMEKIDRLEHEKLMLKQHIIDLRMNLDDLRGCNLKANTG